MSVFLAPTFGVGYQGMTLNGALLSGGQIYTYQAGSSTLQPTYTTSAGTIQNTNPIILDASGKPPAEVWLTQGQAYKFVVMDSLSNVIATYDNVSGINDVVFTSTFSEWVATGLTPTYLNTTQFTVPGNQTTVLQVNRRVQITCTAGVIYGYISASVYTSLTTVTVVMDSTPLDSGISIVNVAFLSGANQSVPANVIATASLINNGILNKPASGDLGNCTNFPGAQVTGAVANATNSVNATTSVNVAGGGTVTAATTTGQAVTGTASGNGYGVFGTTVGGNGVYGGCTSGVAVKAVATTGYGLQTESNASGYAPLRIVPSAQPANGFVGDMYMTTLGVLKVCTVAGSPGTWVSVGTQT